MLSAAPAARAALSPVVTLSSVTATLATTPTIGTASLSVVAAPASAPVPFPSTSALAAPAAPAARVPSGGLAPSFVRHHPRGGSFYARVCVCRCGVLAASAGQTSGWE